MASAQQSEYLWAMYASYTYPNSENEGRNKSLESQADPIWKGVNSSFKTLVIKIDYHNSGGRNWSMPLRLT